MEINWIEILGIVAGTCTTFSFIPQVKKTLHTGSTKDLSLLMCVSLDTGLILWTVYGYLIQSISVIAANSITFFFVSIVLVFKIKNYKKDKGGLDHAGLLA